jgi:hypothetical protein
VTKNAVVLAGKLVGGDAYSGYAVLESEAREAEHEAEAADI